MRFLSLRQHVHWYYVDTVGQIRRALRGSTSLLDVGGGDGSHWGPVWDALGLDVTMVDRNSSSLRHQQSPWQDVVADATWLPFRSGSFDAVVALDVIEHLPKDAGYLLIGEMERVAARTVIILTPYGFLPQPAASENRYQEHLSGWLPEELKQRGYVVLGTGGPRPLRGMYGHPRIRPRRLGTVVSMVLQPLVYKMPNLAFALVAIKNHAARLTTGPLSAEARRRGSVARRCARTTPQRMP